MTAQLKELVLEKAAALGFDAVRITTPDAASAAGTRLTEFLAAGRHGDMDWMAANCQRRQSPTHLWPEVRSIVMLGMSYAPVSNPLDALDHPQRGAISVYAQGKDYHDILKGKLKQLAGQLASASGADVKVFVDTAPVMEKPLAAAAGIGCSLALMGDIIIAGESAYFLQAFRRIGLVPDGGSSWLLPRMIGRARAMEMMLLGEKLPAAKALEWGLINRCVADAQLSGAAQAMAKELAQGPKSLAMIRKLAWDGLETEWKAQLDAERATQREAGRTSDFIEGVSAFLQKRPANFTGR